MRKLFLISVLATAWMFSSSFAAATSWNISSPGNKVKATVQFADLAGTADYTAGQKLYYTVSVGGPSAFTEVIPTSPMGIIRSDAAFVNALTFVSEGTQTTIDSTYTMVTGKRLICRNYCNEKVLTFQNAANAKLEVVLRAYEDGFAFRYRFPETNATELSITSEATGFRLPAGSIGWMVPYNARGDAYAPAYEDCWQRNVPVGQQTGLSCKPNDSTWCLPALFKTTNNCWAMVWETDVTPNYCNSRLSAAKQNIYRITFPHPKEDSGIGSANPSNTLPWVMPWRVIIAGTSVGTILESTLTTDLATPSTLTDVSWIKPGRSSWSWWSSQNSPTNYDSLKLFIDLANTMTWEYSCIDVDWNLMKNGGTWQQLVTYAASKKVGLNVWYNAAGPINAINNGPRDKMYDSLPRNTEMDMISKAGIKGVKIDFWLSDKQNIIKKYWDVFRDAAKYKLLVDPHGCTIPRGWQRTFPNLITAEAVRGAEMYIWDKDDPTRFPWQHTMMPFTRNAVGSMDWTPVTFTKNASAPVARMTSVAHELALSVIFESGIQHFADKPSAYKPPIITTGVQEFLKQVPVAWDDTKYVQGYPGTWVVLARKKGNDWYAAGITGDTAKNMTVNLSFLQPSPASYSMTLITDGATTSSFTETSGTVNGGDSIKINSPVRGGWVAKFVATTNTIQQATAEFSHSALFTPANFKITGETFTIPSRYVGKKVEVAVYSLDGTLLKNIMSSKKVYNVKKDFSLSPGAYVVRVGKR